MIPREELICTGVQLLCPGRGGGSAMPCKLRSIRWRKELLLPAHLLYQQRRAHPLNSLICLIAVGVSYGYGLLSYMTRFVQ